MLPPESTFYVQKYESGLVRKSWTSTEQNGERQVIKKKYDQLLHLVMIIGKQYMKSHKMIENYFNTDLKTKENFAQIWTMQLWCHKFGKNRRSSHNIWEEHFQSSIWMTY